MPKRSPAARRALVEERKAQILAAATKVFARKGFERATIAEIAREAGVAEGSIYNYFKNKGDLLISIPRQIVGPRIQGLFPGGEVPLDGAVAPEVLLTRAAENVIGLATENTEAIRVILSALPTLSPALRQKYVQDVVLLALRALEGYIQAQVRAGVFRRDLNPAIAARAFPGMLFLTLLLQEMMQPEVAERIEYPEFIANIVQLYLYGVTARPCPESAPGGKREPAAV